MFSQQRKEGLLIDWLTDSTSTMTGNQLNEEEEEGRTKFPLS